ncbi:hypothetical protein PF005_g14618, partial [Phytophthora fragariae]
MLLVLLAARCTFLARCVVGALRRRRVADGVCATAPAPHFRIRIRFPATSAALAVPLHFTTSTPHQHPRPTSAMPRRHPAWDE